MTFFKYLFFKSIKKNNDLKYSAQEDEGREIRFSLTNEDNLNFYDTNGHKIGNGKIKDDSIFKWSSSKGNTWSNVDTDSESDSLLMKDESSQIELNRGKTGLFLIHFQQNCRLNLKKFYFSKRIL